MNELPVDRQMVDRKIEELPRRQISVIVPGPQSLVQDGGRTGFQKLGVSVSGAADMDALHIGNRLVGNDPNAAAIEILLGSAEFVFEHEAVFALTGAETGATLDGISLATNVSYSAHAASSLVLGMAGPGNGLRAYLAVAGGIDSQPVLGSRSTHIASEIGGVDGRALAAGDVFKIGEPSDAASSGNTFGDLVLPSISLQDVSDLQTVPNPPQLPKLNVRVVLGPQDDEFSDEGIRTFLNSTYVVTDQSNRQGLRLDGPEVESRSGSYDIVSDAVVNGSVQVPGDGKPIVLLADRQTTGGYAKVATVASVDLPKLGQAAPGTNILFSAISVEESQELLATRSKQVLDSQLVRVIEPTSFRVNELHVSIGVAENEGSTATGIALIGQVNGVAYPISVERYTPAE